MDVIDQLALEKWKETIGILPKGFSISIESGELQLHYCVKWERPVLVCSHYVGNIAETAIEERANIARFISSNVANFQREKLIPKKNTIKPTPKKTKKKGEKLK